MENVGPHFVRLIHVLIANYALPPEFRDPLLLFLYKGGHKPTNLVKSFRPLGVTHQAMNILSGVLNDLVLNKLAFGPQHYRNRRQTDCHQPTIRTGWSDGRMVPSGRPSSRPEKLENALVLVPKKFSIKDDTSKKTLSRATTKRSRKVKIRVGKVPYARI